MNRDDDDEKEVEVEKGDKPVIDVLPVDPLEPFVPLHILCSSLCKQYICILFLLSLQNIFKQDKMASLAINLNVSTKLLNLSFMTHDNGKLPTFRCFNCTFQTQKDKMYFNTFRLLINIKKNLKVANPFCPVDDKQFLDQVLKPETVETFTQSLQNLWIFSAAKS